MTLIDIINAFVPEKKKSGDEQMYETEYKVVDLRQSLRVEGGGDANKLFMRQI